MRHFVHTLTPTRCLPAALIEAALSYLPSDSHCFLHMDALQRLDCGVCEEQTIHNKEKGNLHWHKWLMANGGHQQSFPDTKIDSVFSLTL